MACVQNEMDCTEIARHDPLETRVIVDRQFHNEVALNSRQCKEAWAARRHEFVHMCVNEITKKLFGYRIIPVRGAQRLQPTPEFESYIQRNFEPLSRDAFESILAFGVVPVAFQRASQHGLGDDELIPYVPRFGTYTITTSATKGIQHYSFYWSSGPGIDNESSSSVSKPDKKVIIFHDFGYDPDLEGNLNSSLSSINSQLKFVDELHTRALEAERINAIPPIITAYAPARSVPVDEGVKRGFYAGDASTSIDVDELEYQRSAQEMRVYQHQMRQHMQQYSLDPQYFGSNNNSMPAADRNGPIFAHGCDWKGHEMPWARTHSIGPARDVVSYNMPRARGDLVALTEQTKDIICGVLNIPKGAISTSSTVRAGAELVADSMMKTVIAWSDLISRLLTQLYEKMYGKQDIEKEVRITILKKRSRFPDTPQLLTDKDLFSIRQRTEVKFVFDLPPASTPDRLQHLYLNGIINWTVYAENMLRVNNLSRDQLARSTDLYSVAERKSMLLRNSGKQQSSSSSYDTSPQDSKKRKSVAHEEVVSTQRESARQSRVQ